MNPTGPQGADASPRGPKVRRVVKRRSDTESEDQRGRAMSDRDEVWGEGDTSNDERLRRDVPPHASE